MRILGRDRARAIATLLLATAVGVIGPTAPAEAAAATPTAGLDCVALGDS